MSLTAYTTILIGHGGIFPGAMRGYEAHSEYRRTHEHDFHLPLAESDLFHHVDDAPDIYGYCLADGHLKAAMTNLESLGTRLLRVASTIADQSLQGGPGARSTSLSGYRHWQGLACR